jgi:hypothetical protein
MMLGGMGADLRHLVRWCDEHERADQCRFDALADRLDIITAALPRIEKLEKVVEKIEPTVESIRNAKLVAAGFTAAIGLIGGVFGGLGLQVFKLLT